MTIGEKIKHYRKIKGLTQKQLGESLGLSAQAVAQWETGNRKPKNETLEKITDALGISLFDLLEIEAEPLQPYELDEIYFYERLKFLGYELFEIEPGDRWLCVSHKTNRKCMLTWDDVANIKGNIDSFIEFTFEKLLSDRSEP